MKNHILPEAEATGHWQYQYLDIILELFIGAKKNCENWTGKQDNC
jgi:hypothetical protein